MVNNNQVVLQECKVVLSRFDSVRLTPFCVTMSVDDNCCVCDSISQMNYFGLKSCKACSDFFQRLKRDKNKLKEVICQPCQLNSEENKCLKKFIKKCRPCRARKCLEVGFKCDEVSASDISIGNASGSETINSIKRKNKSSSETVTKDPKKHKKKQVSTGNLDDNLGSTSKCTLDEMKKEKYVDALEGKCGKDSLLHVYDTSDYTPVQKSSEVKKLSTVSDKKNNEDTVKSRVKNEKRKRKRIVFIESDSSSESNSFDESKEHITVERIKKKKDIHANLSDRKFKNDKTDMKSHIKSELIAKKGKKDSNELNSLSETHLICDEQRKRKLSVNEKKKNVSDSNLSDKKMKDNKTKKKSDGKNSTELIQEKYKHAAKPNSASKISLLTKVDTNLHKSISSGQHNVKKSEIINKKGEQSETKPSRKDVKKLSKVISGSEHLSLHEAEENARLESEAVGVKKSDLNKSKENKSMKKDDSKKSSKPKKENETNLTGDKSKSSKSDQQNVKKTTTVLNGVEEISKIISLSNIDKPNDHDLVRESEKKTKDTQIVIDDKVCLPAKICSPQKSKKSGYLDLFSDNELDYDYNDAIDGDEEEVSVINQDFLSWESINADKVFKSDNTTCEDDDKSSMNSCPLNIYCGSSETESDDENEEFENVPNNEICDSNNESEKKESVAVNMSMGKQENITALLPSLPEASSLPSDFVVPENIAEENDDDIISIFAPNIDLLQLDSSLIQGLSWKKNDSQLRCPVKKEFSNFKSKPNADASASKSNITSSQALTSSHKPTSNFAPKSNVTKSQSTTSPTKQISNIASQSNIDTRQATTSSKSLISTSKPNITTSLSPSRAFNPISNVASHSDNITSQPTSTTSSNELISNVVTNVATSQQHFLTIDSNSSFEENSISKIQMKDIYLKFLKASRENDLVSMQNIYNERKEVIGDDFRPIMVEKLISVCLKINSIRQAFLYLSDIKQLKMEKSLILAELLDYCSTLPKTEENLRNEFIQYLVSVKYPIDGGRLRRNLDEFLKKGYVTSLWKLFNYSVNLNYHPSCKLCEWAIDQLAENEDKLYLVLTVFYKSAENEKKISQKSLNELRKFTTKNGGLENVKLLDFLQKRNYTLSDAKKDRWKMFCETSQFDEKLMNELLLTFYEDISVAGQSFSSFFDFVKERLSRDPFFKRLITQIGFTVILECHIRKEYKSGHTVILIIFGDGRNHFELLETNDLVPVITILQMALACIDICMQVNDVTSALVLLKAGQGATPSDDFENVEQRLLRFNLLYTLFEKLIEQNETDNQNLIYLYECLLKTHERDCAVLKRTCVSPGPGLSQVWNKLMTYFLEINNFELARVVYNKGKSYNFWMGSDCYRGYLVLMKRNEHHGAVDADELFKLYKLCQMRGVYPVVESFAKSQWVVKILSSYVYEELQVILEYYLKSLADHLKEQNECKPVIIAIEEWNLETSLTVLLSSTDLPYTLDRIAKALREMNPSIYIESCGSDKRFLKLESSSLESFIKQRIQEGSCAGI